MIMRAALQTFEAGLSGLIEYLDSTENEAKLLALLSGVGERVELSQEVVFLLNSIEESHVRRKQYIYTVTIVSLYGLLERYVNSIIVSFVQTLTNIAVSYSSMPSAIINNHVTRSMELIKALGDDKFRKSSLTVSQVIENLHLCLSGASNFCVNGSAFSLHRGNLTGVKIGEFLTGVGVDNHLRRVIVTESMVKYIEEQYPERQIGQIADQDLPNIFEPLDGLVERRNEVSHGVIDIDDLESISLLKKRCDFVDAYVHGLHAIFLQEIARAYTAAESTSLKLGVPIEVYNKSVVCFEASSGSISVGDLLISATGNDKEPFRFGPVERIEVNNEAQQSISITTSMQFALKVGFRAGRKHSYWVLRECDGF